MPGQKGVYKSNPMTTIVALSDSRDPYSPCANADRVVGNVTVKYRLTLDASKTRSGYVSVGGGSWTDSQSGEEVEDAGAFNLKWLIRKCP